MRISRNFLSHSKQSALINTNEKWFFSCFYRLWTWFFPLSTHSYLPDEKRSHKNFLVAVSLEINGNLQIVDIFSSLPIRTRDAGKFLSSLVAHSWGLKFHLYSVGCCWYFVSLNLSLIKSRSISCGAAWLKFLPWEISTLIELIVRKFQLFFRILKFVVVTVGRREILWS